MRIFLKIYIWQILSLVTGFATMFVVTPFLSSNQNHFGIYTFVISLGLFLSYADFGFLSAGAKFASEAYAREDRQDEQGILGFVFFIMTIVFGIFGLVILVFYFNPNYILKGIENAPDLKLTKDLLLIFILSLPIIIAQRGIQLVFNIRLHDHIYQRVFSICNLLRIVSVLYFFQGGNFDIVGFYIFSQLTTLLSIILGCFLARKHFNYEFIPLFKSIKYNRDIYEKTKSLAFNSLFITISWVLYYELDSLIIGRFVGLKEVAIFNICISIMSFSRSLYSIIYNPFSAKFNHFIGRNEEGKIISAYEKILIIGVPLSVIPTTILILTMKNFVHIWVGRDYEIAIPIISIMFASYYYTFLSNPTSLAMVAMQNIRSLYLSTAVLPIVYWLGIVMTFQFFGLLSFGIFKFVAFSVSALIYFYFGKKTFSINWSRFFYRNILPALLTIFLLVILAQFFNKFLPNTKGKREMLIFIFIISLYGAASLIFYYWLSKDFKKVMKDIYLALFSPPQ